MAEPARPLWLLALVLAAWALAFGWSGVAAFTTPPSGDGFTRGMNRVSLFLGWQGVAFLLGFTGFALGRGWPKGSGIRRVSAVPLWVTLLLVAAIGARIGWAVLQA